ncbi:MAG: TetR/AcrR family transcriptional regulator [Bacteroidales bacterium]|nr:TetR/AcrR family transcriptional regulator [Bacteroidales bacterium]
MKKENKESEILQAAERLFAEKGFKGATTTLIASEAGVTHAMLHYYFRTKEHIFLKVLDLYMSGIWSELKSIMVPDFYDIGLIRKATEVIFDFFSEHRGQMALLMEVAKERPDLLRDYVSDSGRYLGSAFSAHRERIDRAVKEGIIRDITFNDLFMDIISVCSVPFIFEPVLSNMTGMDENRRKMFLEARKKEAVELISARLRHEK